MLAVEIEGRHPPVLLDSGLQSGGAAVLGLDLTVVVLCPDGDGHGLRFHEACQILVAEPHQVQIPKGRPLLLGQNVAQLGRGEPAGDSLLLGVGPRTAGDVVVLGVLLGLRAEGLRQRGQDRLLVGALREDDMDLV